MKRRLLSILLVLMLLTGCSKQNQVLMTFHEKEDVSYNDVDVFYQTPTFSNTFAKNLCIIPSDFASAKDSILTASSTLIINSTDNKEIYGRNIYEKLYPASITKIVTALVTLKYGDLDDTVTISKNAANITESGAKLCGFKEGDKINLKDLLTCLLVYSGNDAGIAIAEHIGGSEEKFSDMMNTEVRKLGAVDSHFVNAHGLHNDDHYTTAYDLYLIFHELIKDETFINIINTTSFKAEYEDANGKSVTKVFENTNRYLKGTTNAPDGITVIGGKTGTTAKAGSCLILYSKDKDEKEYISVVLKASTGDDLFKQMTRLLSLIP